MQLGTILEIAKKDFNLNICLDYVEIDKKFYYDLNELINEHYKYDLRSLIESCTLNELQDKKVNSICFFYFTKGYNCKRFKFKVNDNLLPNLYKKFIAIKAAETGIKEVAIIENLKLQEFELNNFIYATTYGFGYFCLFLNEKYFEKLNLELSKQLVELGVDFKNEYSDKFWVYRYKISNDKTKNIEILKKIKLEN
jgi:hypothetical protein